MKRLLPCLPLFVVFLQVIAMSDLFMFNFNFLYSGIWIIFPKNFGLL